MMHVYARYAREGGNVIRTTARCSISTAALGRLTHVGADLSVVINTVVDYTRETPVANGVIHCGSGGIGYGFTTSDPDTLEAAGQALIQAAILLRQAQEAKSLP